MHSVTVIVLGVGGTVVAGSEDGIAVEQFTPIQLVAFTSVKVEFVIVIFILLAIVDGGSDEADLIVTFCDVGRLVVILPVDGGSVTVIATRILLFLHPIQAVARGPVQRSHCG
jgi:hypothetical protein